jgi:hypothetical protein
MFQRFRGRERDVRQSRAGQPARWRRLRRAGSVHRLQRLLAVGPVDQGHMTSLRTPGGWRGLRPSGGAAAARRTAVCLMHPICAPLSHREARPFAAAAAASERRANTSNQRGADAGPALSITTHRRHPRRRCRPRLWRPRRPSRRRPTPSMRSGQRPLVRCSCLRSCLSQEQRSLPQTAEARREVSAASSTRPLRGPHGARRQQPHDPNPADTTAASPRSAPNRRPRRPAQAHRRPAPLCEVAQVRPPAAPAPRAVDAPQGAAGAQPVRDPPRGQEPGRGAVQAAAQVGGAAPQGGGFGWPARAAAVRRQCSRQMRAGRFWRPSTHLLTHQCHPTSIKTSHQLGTAPRTRRRRRSAWPPRPSRAPAARTPTRRSPWWSSTASTTSRS